MSRQRCLQWQRLAFAVLIATSCPCPLAAAVACLGDDVIGGNPFCRIVICVGIGGTAFCSSIVSVVTCCPHFCSEVLGGDPFALLASVMAVLAALPSAATSCSDDDLSARRFRWRPVVSVIQQQRYVSTKMSLVVTSSSILSQGRWLWWRAICLAGFCVGIGGGVYCGSTSFRWQPLFSGVIVVICCLGTSTAASCLGDDALPGGDPFVSLASVLVLAAPSRLSRYFGSSVLPWLRCLWWQPCVLSAPVLLTVAMSSAASLWFSCDHLAGQYWYRPGVARSLPTLAGAVMVTASLGTDRPCGSCSDKWSKVGQ